ncbi:CBS domain-containing protein [Methyloceanibacter sp.]|uniref:CBS domain-containing protein n=1 Tax=Methyloceanibacter sp. TaxID=1965321 RepID=UPI002D27EEB5|nr:CBS domain-containing protein [Methyloceanibacter sp.]HZP10312.1 CBS domain-containing protein [Methyloceanibacter sp.]
MAVPREGTRWQGNELPPPPVVDGYGHLVGLITERNFLRPGAGHKRPRWFQVLAGRVKKGLRQQAGRKVDDVMTPDPIIATEDASLDQVVVLVDRHSFHRLPVMRGTTLAS